jgi:hypothetical protein
MSCTVEHGSKGASDFACDAWLSDVPPAARIWRHVPGVDFEEKEGEGEGEGDCRLEERVQPAGARRDLW